jgi:tetratricopeptide (TPR) repeat protein
MATIAELFQHALQYHQQGYLAQAEPLYRQILQTDPTHAEAYHLLGLLSHQTGHSEAALGLLRQAVSLSPNSTAMHFNLGIVFLSRGQLVEAANCFRETLRLDPANVQALFNLGNVLKDLGQLEQAIACFRRVCRQQPTHTAALNNLGILLQDQGCYDEAIQCFREVLRLQLANVDAYNNLGMAFKDIGQVVEAGACFEQALRIQPDHPTVLWNRCLLRLQSGYFADAWIDYEHRWTQTGMIPRTFPQPRWDGSPLIQKTLLVHAEQGLGDSLQFLRLLPLIQRQGGKVVFECQPALVRLLQGIPGADLIVPAGSRLPDFDLHLPLMSLPGVLGTTLANIPANIAYVSADGALIEQWRQEIASQRPNHSKIFKIGIAWQGDLKHRGLSNRSLTRRSLALTLFEPLAKVKEVALFSLQVGPGSEQIPNAPFPLVDLGSRFDPNSLEDLAATLMNMDLVVTIDTAVAHLAGALGRPVWNLLSTIACWRWLSGREDTPWYPTMRLFRQRQLGEWGEVMERVVNEVRALV